MAPGDPIDGGAISIDGWAPGNFGGEAFGTVSLDEALARSINTAAVRLGEAIGPEHIAERARLLGIASELRPVPSLALGTSEVTPLELTARLPALRHRRRSPAVFRCRAGNRCRRRYSL